MDGVPGLTQPPVHPGETFVYEFAAQPAGTRWYHTHFQGHRQLDLGLAAPLIIALAQPDPFPFDREYTLVLDDWATGLGHPLPSTHEGTAGARGGMGGGSTWRLVPRVRCAWPCRGGGTRAAGL
jgi:FtsP/CotA-like multicopper oxidase with cupredoxin domain